MIFLNLFIHFYYPQNTTLNKSSFQANEAKRHLREENIDIVVQNYQLVPLKLQRIIMFDWLRKIVAGPKNRLVSDKYDLDLTYITDNIIAMAYPATGYEKIYRNCMQDVVAFLQQNHKGRYYVINVSNREYDIDPFEGRVKCYDWDDHQAPCLTTLFDICQFTCKYLKSHQENVVIFHCNHGKGRTGTGIMSLLMYIQDFQNADQVLDFYNQKRFKTNKYVVSQQCQIRFLRFFDQILKNPQQFIFLKAYRISNVKQTGLNGGYYLKITQLRKKLCIYPNLNVDQFVNNIQDAFLMGDIFIELFKSGIIDSRVSRINYHMQFAKIIDNKWVIGLQGPNLSLQKCQSSQFSIVLQFQLYCQCHIREKWNAKCLCFHQRQKEEWHWKKMHHIIKNKPKKGQQYTFANTGSEEPIYL